MEEKSLEWHINPSGLSNIVVEDMTKFPKWIQEKSHYVGVYKFFELPLKIGKMSEFSLIVNVGMHFVSIYGTKQFILYIDPYGLPMMQKQMREYFSVRDIFSRPIYFNPKQIQDTLSTHCAMFCTLFVLHLEAKRLPNLFPSYQNERLIFSGKDLKKNDTICEKMIKKIISNTSEFV